MPDLDALFDHERLHVFRDAPTGLTGAIAIHSTVLGPAMGGLRLHPYASIESAMGDALRLARAMTLKNAAADLDLGGGKAVLVDDGAWRQPATRAERMRAVGRVIDGLQGAYVTAEDVGTSPADMDRIAETTRWVAGRPVAHGGRGDPSPATARTVFGAIGSGARIALGRDGLEGVHVAVLGVGHVGAALVGLLRDAGARVTLTDVDAARAVRVAGETGATAVAPDGFLEREVDVLAPCAMGELLDLASIGRLRCAVVAGAANNPLADPGGAAALAAAGILYVPDFLANCGGIIHVGGEVLGYDDAEVERRLGLAVARTEDVLQAAATTGRLPLDLAVERATARIAAAAPLLQPVAA
jgi:glutamate dehydrogenase/leucine dehydrogenase